MAHDLAAALTRARKALAPSLKSVPERYGHIDFRPPEGVRQALRLGLELHEQGHSGDGLQPETVAWARRLAGGEAISPEKARAMNAWFARHRAQGTPDRGGEPTPKLVSDLLWGGDPGQAWSGKLVEQMEAADRAEKAGPPSLAERARAALARLRPEQPATKEAIVTGDLGPGVTPAQIIGAEELEAKKGTEPPGGIHEKKPVVVGQIATAEAAAPAPTPSPPPGPGTGSSLELPPRLVDFGGIPVLIDRPKGHVIRKLDDAGNLLWERTYSVDYGFFAGTDGGDQEGLDVFLGPDPAAPVAWWAVQTREDGSFDEYKVFLGFADEAAARACYVAHIPERFLASMTPMPVDRIRSLLGLPPAAPDVATKAAPASPTKLLRSVKALTAATTYKGPTRPAEEIPETVRAVVGSAPLTWRYQNPDDVGGWLGGIEPEDESWIAFVAVDGGVLLWTEREPTGGVTGAPFALQRPDLARPHVELVASTKAATPDEQFIFGIVLMPERTDLQKEIYGHQAVRRTGHDFLAFFRNTDLQHKVYINDAVELVESTIEKVAFWMARDGTAFPADPATGAPLGVTASSPYRAGPEGNLRFVPQGTWTVAHRIKDPELWAAIKRGDYTGYSINGLKKLAA